MGGTGVAASGEHGRRCTNTARRDACSRPHVPRSGLAGAERNGSRPGPARDC